MNRLFCISLGILEVKGLISSGELPDLINTFYRLSEDRGAHADYVGDGLFVAVKGEVKLSLMIGAFHEAIPSRLLFDVLEELMDKAF